MRWTTGRLRRREGGRAGEDQRISCGLASALLLKALQNGHRGAFMRAQELFDEMYASTADRSTRRRLNRLAEVDVLVPIDNSPTGREFQNVAKLRLNMLLAGSTEGAHRACVFLAIMATCRAQGVPAQAYLAWAFERLGTHREVFALPLEDLTPAAFKKSLA